jgi:membrane protein implicated in regulation of membrane protease activity
MNTSAKILIGLGAAFLLFELAEHVIFPLVWLLIGRKRRSPDVLGQLIGKEATVTVWKQSQGQVFVRGEIWRAVSKEPLLPGEKVIVQKVDGLTLTVSALNQGSLEGEADPPLGG